MCKVTLRNQHSIYGRAYRFTLFYVLPQFLLYSFYYDITFCRSDRAEYLIKRRTQCCHVFYFLTLITCMIVNLTPKLSSRKQKYRAFFLANYLPQSLSDVGGLRWKFSSLCLQCLTTHQCPPTLVFPQNLTEISIYTALAREKKTAENQVLIHIFIL